MRKHTVFLITGLVLCAASIGLFRSTTYHKVEAASNKLSYDKDNKITLGSFPLNFNIKQSEDATGERIDDFITGIDGSFSLGVINITTVDGKKYGFIPSGTTINKDGGANVGDAKLPSGVTEIKNATDKPGVVFDFADLKWVKYEETDDYIDFISDYIIYRDVFDDGGNGPDYENSTLCNHLNNEFIKIAFSKEDKEYLVQKDIGGSQRYVDIPKLDKVGSGNGEPSCSGPSDIAILDHISSKESYKNAPYWTQDKSGSRVSVRWYNKTVTDCLTFDDNIGVRPIIRIKASMIGKSGGGSSRTIPTLPSINPAIPVGIIFGVLGAGGLVAFFILWNKKLKEDPTFKAPGWYYAIIFVAAACCCVSTITFSTQSISGEGGGGLGGCTFKCGYYLQSTAKYEDANANFVQVGLACYLFRSDGTVSYCAAVEKEDASDFRADSGSGSWTQSGCTLKFTYTTPIGSVAPTFTISGTKLLYNGKEAYHWVRGE